MHMTPTEFTNALRTLGLSESEAAREFRVKDSRSIRQYKAGDRQISGPLSYAVESRLKFGPLSGG
jgi:hypothetical protein